MDTRTVDFAKSDRGALFSADEEARAAGQTVDEPYPMLLKLLEGPPVQKGSLEELMGIPQQIKTPWRTGEAYSVLSFDAVNKAFLDAETFTNEVYDNLSKRTLGDTLLNMNGARHRRMRDVSKDHFKRSFTDGWWTDKWIVRAVNEIVDRLATKDRADLNLELCAPLPMSVVSIGFGIPTAEILPFRKALHELMSHHSPEQAARGMAEVDRVMKGLIAARRAEPQDDLVSRLVHADLELEVDGTRKLTDDEVMRYCMLIVHAGGGTTWRQLGIAIMALLNNPDQLEALRNDRSLMRSAVQESTRWYPTDPMFLRSIARDTVLEGVEMRAGGIAYLCLATANRDRKQWKDPDSFDIRRPIQRHFAFGAGPHACLGQHLSRQEMEVALNAVLDRLGDLRWDPDQPPARMSGGTLLARGPNALHVRYTPRS
jgi:cytochrome P450